MLSVHKEAIRILLFDDLTMPVVKLEHIVALKIFAMKNDPDRALRKMADIKELINLPGTNIQEVQKYFEKYGLMERYYDIIGEKQKK